MEKLIFQSKNEKELFIFLESKKNRKILNFLNQHDMYLLNNISTFKKSLNEKQNMNFIDGFIISAYLSIKNLKRVPRIRGPTFTRDFLSDTNLSKDKKHFFIGLENEDLKSLRKKFPHLKHVKAYNPIYINNLNFPEKEIKKITTLINKVKYDYVWVGIGSPKQNLLSSELFSRTDAQYFVNVGAALDFFLEKKKEAPLIIREMGIEWFYRLITDFEHSKKKVWRSFVGLKYIIGNIELK